MSDATDVDDASTETTTMPDRPTGKVVRKNEADAQAIIDAIHRAAHPDNDLIAERKDPLDDAHVAALDAEENRIPDLRYPGFGEPDGDCEEFILPAMRFCTKSGKTKQFKHNCLRYDCPKHAPYAVRRRAAGYADGPGMAPQLKSLISWLYSYRDTPHHFHHLFVSLPTDRIWLFESSNPVERGKQVCREIMDELGIQGAVILHPSRGPKDGPEGDARGWYKDNLFKGRDWKDVHPELRREPHFHIIGAAAHVDVSVTDQVYEETGWIIARREDDEGRSIVGRDGDPNDSDDDAMARTLTYCLSHAGVYEKNGQRRLAAWMKGPDVNKVETYDYVKKPMQQKVYRAAETVLGISPPDLECDCRECGGPDRDPRDDVDEDADGSVSMASMTKPVSPGRGGPAARDPFSSFGAAAGPASDGYELPSPPTKWTDFNRPAGAWKESSGSSSTSTTDRKESSDSRGAASDDQEKCGSYLRHISQAGEYLLDASWRERANFGDELEETYRNYVDYMTSRDLDPLEDGIPELPDERGDPPPD